MRGGINLSSGFGATVGRKKKPRAGAAARPRGLPGMGRIATPPKPRKPKKPRV